MRKSARERKRESMRERERKREHVRVCETVRESVFKNFDLNEF